MKKFYGRCIGGPWDGELVDCDTDEMRVPKPAKWPTLSELSGKPFRASAAVETGLYVWRSDVSPINPAYAVDGCWEWKE